MPVKSELKESFFILPILMRKHGLISIGPVGTKTIRDSLRLIFKMRLLL